MVRIQYYYNVYIEFIWYSHREWVCSHHTLNMNWILIIEVHNFGMARKKTIIKKPVYVTKAG